MIINTRYDLVMIVIRAIELMNIFKASHNLR